jgi:hypothetical protein
MAKRDGMSEHVSEAADLETSFKPARDRSLVQG